MMFVLFTGNTTGTASGTGTAYPSRTNDHGYGSFVVGTSHSFTHSWFITGAVTRVTQRLPQVEQERFTLPEHLSSPSVFCRVRVAQYLVFYIAFCRSLFVILSFFFLVIVLLLLLRFTASDYPFGVFFLIMQE
jgi:hypothetical protein